MKVSPPGEVWLAGMPEHGLAFGERHVPHLPLGCREHARAILASCKDGETLRRQLDREYLAVLDALLEAGMPFRILNLSVATSPLAEHLRAEGYPEFKIDAPPLGSTYTYPRDLMVYLAAQGIALVSESWLKPGTGDRGGVTCWPTCWSEGGRVLMSGDTLVVFRHPEKERAPDQATLDRLRDRGLQVVELPAAIFCSLDREGEVTGLFHEHHIDRAAGLLRDDDGKLHLLLGPGYHTGPLLEPLGPTESLDAIRRSCDAANIEVHVVPDTSPPYASSLVQNAAGVVVASGGGAGAVMAGILGSEKVVETSVPLRFFPVFAGAGLHCLVTESPDFLVSQ